MKEGSLVQRRARFSELICGSATLNSAMVFSLAFGVSDVVLLVSMLWQRWQNWEDEFYGTHRLGKQSLFLWKLSEYYKNTVDVKKECNEIERYILLHGRRQVAKQL